MLYGIKVIILFNHLRQTMDLRLRFNHKIILDDIWNPQIRVEAEID